MAELPYLFDLKLFDRLIGLWTGFAATGRSSWPAFGKDGYVQSLTSGTWRRAAFTADHAYRFWADLPRA